MFEPMNLPAIETRKGTGTETADAEVRFTAPSDTGELEGIAVRFNVADSYRSEFAPQAFTSARTPIPMLWSHDPAQVIGSWTSIEARADGLAVKGRLNLAVAKAQEVRALLQAGDVAGLSVGFRTLKDERSATGTRRITQADLKEISIVAFPSVPGSQVTSTRSTANLTALTKAIRAATTSIKGN